MIRQVLVVARLNLAKRLQKQIFSYDLKHIIQNINSSLFTKLYGTINEVKVVKSPL